MFLHRSNYKQTDVLKYFPNGTVAPDARAFVADDPHQLFIAQQDSDATNLVAANLNENCNLVFGNGSTTTGISKLKLIRVQKNTTGCTSS